MARHLVVGFLSLCGVMATLAPARAQAVLDDLYGQGVHAYFDGDLQAAANWFSEAIDQGTRDPRAYYYRGVVYHRLGDEAAAAQDFAKGAALETDGSDQFFPVAESLARVQGSSRSQIEQARREARKAARERLLALERARYEATVAAEARVLRGANRNQVIQLQTSPDIAASFRLPFPNEQTGGSRPFDITEMAASAERIASGVTVREAAPTIIDPVAPAVPEVDPLPTPGDEPTAPGSTAAEENVSGSNVLGGLFRAFSNQIPDPSAALQALPPGVPGLPGSSAPPTDFDPDQAPTQPGQNPFGPGN